MARKTRFIAQKVAEIRENWAIKGENIDYCSKNCNNVEKLMKEWNEEEIENDNMSKLWGKD